MAHFSVSSDGRIHREKTKKEKEQQAARAKKEAATQLKQSRSNYQNYVSGERNRIISNQNRQQFDRGASLSDRLAPIDQLRQKQQERRNKQQEQNDYNKYVTDRLRQDNKIKYGPDELPGTNKIQNRKNDLEQRASKNAAALKQASQTDTAKELKKDVRIKQNEYNIANYLENQAKVNQERTTNFDRLVNPIVSGLGELTDFSRLTGTQDVYDYETGKKTFLPNRREIKQQKVRQDSKGAWGVYNDVSYNMSKAIGAKILDSVTFGGGTALYYGNMVGDATEEARQQGFSKDEALLYGGTVGVIGATLDKALDSFGGLSAFSSKVPTLTQGVDKVFYKMLGNKTASTLLSNVTREAFSEFAEEYADNIAKYMINADATDADSFMDMIAKTTPDAMYSGLIGGISGGVGRVAERNTVDMQERLKALDDYKATLEGVQPQSIPEAQYKEDQLTQVDNQINEINTQMEQNQTAPNTTEQVQTQPQQQVNKYTQELESTKAEQQEIINQDEKGNVAEPVETRKEQPVKQQETQVVQNTKQVAQKVGLSKQSTSKVVNDVKTIENTRTKTPIENVNTGDVTYTSKGISTNLNEKMTEDVLKITEPSEKPKTVTISDKENSYQVKKPSAELATKDMSEQVGKYFDNISTTEKQEIKRETQKKNKVFARGQEYAKNTNDKQLQQSMKKLENQAYYNQLDIKANMLNNIIDTYKDVDARAESFDADYLKVTAGTLDGNSIEVSNELIAKGQGLAVYYLDNHMTTEASDILLKLGKLGTASGQASAQFNAMYQYTPYGIYTQTVNNLQQAYNEMAARKSNAWAEKNNPDKNPNSKFRLTQEQTDYILKESSELFDLHGKDFKEYSIRKGRLQNYIGDLIPHGVAEGFSNWIRSSLLLGTRTIFKNDGSNVIDTAYHATNKINYTIYDKAINKVFGTNVRVAGISLDGAKAGLIGGTKTAIRSLSDIITGKNTTEFGNRFSESVTNRENITKDFFDTMPTRYQTKIKALNAAGNWVSQLSNNLMTWGDAKYAAASYEDNRITLRKLNALEQHKQNPSKAVIYEQKIDNSGTAHIDYINTEGKYASAITPNIEAFIKENNMDTLKNAVKIDNLALEYSESRTYSGETTFSKTTRSLIHAIDSAVERVPVFKQTGIKASNFIVPFSKIGSNLCYKMYRGSILSIPSLAKSIDNFTTEVNNKNVTMETQHDLVTRLGDLTTGTIMYVFMGSLAKAAFDNVEGDEDDDEQTKVSKFMKTVFGKDKYSFQVGDFNFSFDVGGNLTNMLKMSLDLQETNEKEDKTVKDYLEVAFNDILSEWTVSNITDLFNQEYNSTALDNILQTIARVPSMAIPSFMKDVAMNIDNFTQRSVWDEDLGTYAINSIKAKIPFVRSSLDAKTDSWGNTMKNGSNLITQVWNTYLVEDQIKEKKHDSVSDELMNVYLTTQQTAVIPNVSKSYFTYKGTKYDLNDKEEQKYLKKYASTAHSKLDKLFNSDTYKQADTETKLKYIKEVYQYANDEAKKEYLQGKNINYYNYGKQVFIVGEDTTFKQSTVLDAIDNNISYDAARQFQKDGEKFKFYNSFGSYEYYKDANDNITDIRTTYSKDNGYSTAQRKQKVIEYVSSLNDISAVQKAILIKQYYPSSYKNYNGKIKEYLINQNMDNKTYQELVDKMKIK